MNQFKSLQVVFSPSRLELNDRFQRFDGKGVTARVRRDRDSSPVSVAVTLMGSSLAHKRKAIAL
jgi:hypothetical protein